MKIHDNTQVKRETLPQINLETFNLIICQDTSTKTHKHLYKTCHNVLTANL